MFTRNDAIKIVKSFIEQCEKINLSFDRVILFGSLARNVENTNSDIDLALVSSHFSDDRFDNALLIAPVKRNFLDIDVQTFPFDYFIKGDPFIEEILSYDIEIN